MDDYLGFCKQRASAAFHRRRKHLLGSDERRHCCKEARQFIGYYRNEQRRIAKETDPFGSLMTAEFVTQSFQEAVEEVWARLKAEGRDGYVGIGGRCAVIKPDGRIIFKGDPDYPI